MKKALFMAIAAILITGLLVVPSMAKGKKFQAGEKGPSGQAGKSNIGHLYLYEKSGDPDWEIVEGGMWGKMKYNLSGPTFDFVFNGHGLPVGQEFTLIYYPDPWPGNGLICLGYGVVMDVGDDNGGGDIHIQGSIDTGSLPAQEDDNYYDGGGGAKIWLVPSEDLDCEAGAMTGWSPGANLYEAALIKYEKTEEALPSRARGKKFQAGEKGPSGQAGKSNIGHLYLYEKSGDPDWEIVEGGMWGKMKYNLSGPTFDFVFNAHGLPVGQEFSLIYYPDPWPGNGLIILGSGVVMGIGDDNGIGGDIHIKGSIDTGSLPAQEDDNYDDGAKIWLVPSENVDTENVDSEAGVMIGWSPGANLYEAALIKYEKTEDEDI